MWLMVQQTESNDYVIATGETRSVRDFVEASLKAAELEIDVDKYVEYDKEMKRPSEVDLLVGDATRAREILKWQAKTSFTQLVELMVNNDLRVENQ